MSFELSQLTELPCLTSLPRTDQAPLDFRLDKSDMYVDTSKVYLYVKCDIVPGEEKERAVPCNNLAYAMWQSVDMFISDQKITSDSTLYPWLSYIVCLTKYSKQYRESALRAGLWRTDVHGLFDGSDGDNEGYILRKEDTKGVFEMYSKVLTEFLHLPKLLPNQLEVAYRFTPSMPDLIFLTNEGSKLKIIDARLYVTKVKLKTSIPRQITYNLSRFSSRVKTVGVGEQNFEWTSFSGICPQKLFLFQVSQTCFNGSVAKNPFNLQTFNLKRIQLFLNDQSLPANASSSFSTSDVVRCYLNSAAAVNEPLAWDITPAAYIGGFFIYVVDLTPDNSAGYDNSTRLGSVRVTIDYEHPQKEAVVVFCVAEFHTSLRIDNFGNPHWA